MNDFLKAIKAAAAQGVEFNLTEDQIKWLVRGAIPPSLWQPLVRRKFDGEKLQALRAVHGDAEVDRYVECEIWNNDQYTVIVDRNTAGSIDTEDGIVSVVHLSIRRNDRGPARDWRDFQRIKDQLCGPEWEGAELFPAQSRLCDSANQFHIWCVPMRWPVGYGERLVAGPEEDSLHKQRPFDPFDAVEPGQAH